MTFIEKLKIEHPDKICYANGKINYGSIDLGCPDEYGYEPKTGTGCSTKRPCAECWNREIPGTENDILKGEKEMAETRKTKKELLEEIAELRKEVERVDKRKQFDDAASDLKMQYDAFVDAGFDAIDAFELLTAMISATRKVG